MGPTERARRLFCSAEHLFSEVERAQERLRRGHTLDGPSRSTLRRCRDAGAGAERRRGPRCGRRLRTRRRSSCGTRSGGFRDGGLQQCQRLKKCPTDFAIREGSWRAYARRRRGWRFVRHPVYQHSRDGADMRRECGLQLSSLLRVKPALARAGRPPLGLACVGGPLFRARRKPTSGRRRGRWSGHPHR